MRHWYRMVGSRISQCSPASEHRSGWHGTGVPVRRALKAFRLFVLVLASLACLAAEAIDPDPKALARGEFIWHPEIAPTGPVVIVVSLDEQRAYVYRNGIGDKPQPRLDTAATFHVSPEFSRRIYDLLVPGTTVLVTDLPATRGAIAAKPTPLFESSGP